MEEALVQSAMAEIAMWDAFSAGRTANATGAIIGCFGGVAVVLWVWKMTDVQAYFYPFASVGSCFLIGYISSLFFKGESETKGLTIHTIRDN